MSTTNFAANITNKKQVWVRSLWMAAREEMFINRFVGEGSGAMIQRITELTKSEKGEEAIIQLVAELVEDGNANDDEREGREEALNNYELVIQMGLINHGVRSKGKLADQKSIINFRSTAYDRLKYWLANRLDQLAMLTMSGIAYTSTLDGRTRSYTTFSSLAFASDVSAPSNKRSLMWDGTALAVSATGSITSAYTASYKMLVDAVAYAKTHFIRGLKSGGKEYFVFICHPMVVAQLKKDPDYLRAMVALIQKNGDSAPWFTGADGVTVDGVVIHSTRLCYNTSGAASGSKWGSGGLVNGTRCILAGAQALAMIDLGDPEWAEEKFQYKSQTGINVDKMFGLLKPVFYSQVDESEQDFGLLTIDLYLGA